MFKLLSKESKIFSIPLYLIFLVAVVILFNVPNTSLINIIASSITFLGIALGYFLFNTINLNYHTHLPLFIYTFIVFAFFEGSLDISIAVSLFTNAYILLTFTKPSTEKRTNSAVLVGAILAINFIFLPATWPMIVFVVLHIISTSEHVLSSIYRFVLGAVLIAFSYFCFMLFLGFNAWNEDYFPFGHFVLTKDIHELYYLIPIALTALYGIFEHFKYSTTKSTLSRFKYNFILVYLLAQLITVVLYMGNEYEYLLFLSFPIAVIVSRAIQYMPKYWMKETTLWLIIFSLLLFKLSNYNVLIS